MPKSPLSDAELAALALEVDAQLAAIRAAEASGAGGGELRGGTPDTQPSTAKQRGVIEAATGEKFEAFWQKYLRHARNDLCLPGGALHDQWKKYRDLESKAAVRVSYGWLAVMGIPAGSLAPVAVAASVFLINAALKIGIDSICEGCAEEAKARAKERQPAAKPAAAKKSKPKVP